MASWPQAVNQMRTWPTQQGLLRKQPRHFINHQPRCLPSDRFIMPDRPFPKARTPVPNRITAEPAGPPCYAELVCRTNYTFLEGASHPDELVTQAAALGYGGLAITDRQSVAGVVRAHLAAVPAKLPLLIGAEIQPVDASPIILWAMNREGYASLTRLITRGRLAAPKGSCYLSFADVVTHSDKLLAGVPLGINRYGRAVGDLGPYHELFGDRLYALVTAHAGPNDHLALARQVAYAGQASVPAVATNDVYYHLRKRRQLYDVLTAIRHKTTVAELGTLRFPNGDRHLKSVSALKQLFSPFPGLMERTLEVVGRCQFSLTELKYDYPEELCPAGESPDSYLTRLTWQCAGEKYPAGIPDKLRLLIEHELQLICQLNYAAYFLTVYDLVRFARSRGILCQGRGSAANSAVCFCLGVTSVDPERIDVLFERFISQERGEAPDIDIDFEHQRREEVLQYIYQKYGRDRAGMTAEVITYRPRSAVRDVGKALGFSLDRIDVVAKSVDLISSDHKLPQRFAEAGVDCTSRTGKQYLHLVRDIMGFPRHLSQHVGGMVLTQRPLCDLVPIEAAAMPGRTVIEWDKDDLDALGILKVDCLALGMLSAIRRALDLVADSTGQRYELATIPAEDPAVYDLLCEAKTMGIFQIESRAQMSMLPRLKPRRFYDLVVEVAIVRPGPIQGGMVHPYLKRRNKEEPVTYPSQQIQSVLQKTLGVVIFQEQAMRVAMVAAGFSAGEADQLRRAMGAWRRPGIIDHFEQKLKTGMQQNGYTADFADRLFKQIRGFGQYGFPESHAASFALLVYASAWLKTHHPAAFLAALLNSQPMGFYAPAQLVTDAQSLGVDVRPVDINASEWGCTLEVVSMDDDRASPGGASCMTKPVASTGPYKGTCHPFAVRLGWRLVQGFSERQAAIVMAARKHGPFVSFDDVVHRTTLTGPQLARIAAADGFQSLGLNRREAEWKALALRGDHPLFDARDEEPAVTLPAMAAAEEVVHDYQAVGLSLKNHPLSFLRSQLTLLGAVCAKDLATLEVERRYLVGGIILLRQRPGTAKGITFMSLEDETGIANLIVHKGTWERFHQVARRAGGLLARGILQRQGQVIHLIVDHLEDLTAHIPCPTGLSRDFR